ncbi:type II toxin-antitoxin system HipA family toxin [Xylophilus rhododendri]|uniref:Type II toxin-antitoxin system HipA family toxin n=1 Tax=Xylophilus rhododendri TaxID=2697032 RepID=A0A857J6N3_9BURK|nr:type II toxin-antitoxin system HipA family toxin [Xylophilus rhododendri]
MISDPASAERQVYVGLAWNDDRQEIPPVGLLKLLRQGVMESGEFAYGRRYLQRPDALALNPAWLPLQDAAFPLAPRRLRDGGALPLTLQDALPDSWGRRVLEARHGGPLDDIDALLLTNDDRVGAMVFSTRLPIQPCDPPGSLLALEAVAEASRQLEAGFEVTPAMQALLRGGASLGGARPKASFFHEGRRHIAKFASRADDCDMEVVEAATLSLAAECGIEVPAFVLQPLSRGHALLVRRFDREMSPQGERRLHYLSCSALLDVAYQSSGGSYVELAQTLRRLSFRPEHDLQELFRRLVFNLAVGNTDDHVKNHGMLQDHQGRWRLAPAFDMVPQFGGMAGYQELAILPGQRDARLALAREAAPHFGLNADRAEEIVSTTLATLARRAAAAVAERGGDEALARRMADFVARQAEAISA